MFFDGYNASAWGYNDDGQCSVPASFSGALAVAAGTYHSLALKSDGTVTAWGLDYEGLCTFPAGLSGVTALSSGLYHSLAVKSDGTVVAWGEDADGKTDVPAGLNLRLRFKVPSKGISPGVLLLLLN